LTIAVRTFLLSAGLCAASPVLAKLVTLANGKAHSLPPLGPAVSLPQPQPTAADGSDFVFKIYGWSRRDSVPEKGAGRNQIVQ
jgi:hypothetical protein